MEGKKAGERHINQAAVALEAYPAVLPLPMRWFYRRMQGDNKPRPLKRCSTVAARQATEAVNLTIEVRVSRAMGTSGLSSLLRLIEDDASRPSMMGNVEPLRAEPWRILQPLNVMADQWQKEVLLSDAERLLLLCSRQSGKSFIMSSLALLDALLHPYAEVLLISKTLRQSTELMLKVKMLWRGLTGGKVHRRGSWQPKSLLVGASVEQQRIKELGWDGAALIQLDKATVDATKDRALSTDFPNGSRITCLPGNPDTIVGFSAVTLLIIDEAARVSDQLYNLVRPFLSATKAVHGRPGRLVVASTPYGKRGWFYEAWNQTEKARSAHHAGCLDRETLLKINGNGDHRGSDRENQVGARTGIHQSYAGADAWLQAHWQLGKEGKEARPPFQAFRVTADQCPRIPKSFLEEERATIGARWYSQEYETEFVDSIDSVFSHDLIHSMVKPGDGEKKLWFED
jgi:hypothetical protein